MNEVERKSFSFLCDRVEALEEKVADLEKQSQPRKHYQSSVTSDGTLVRCAVGNTTVDGTDKAIVISGDSILRQIRESVKEFHK